MRRASVSHQDQSTARWNVGYGRGSQWALGFLGLVVAGAVIVYASAGSSAHGAHKVAHRQQQSRRQAAGPLLSIPSGRILLGIGGGPGAPTRNVAYIDRQGWHWVPAAADPTMEQMRWDGRNAFVFSSRRDGPRRHVFRMTLAGAVRRLTPLRFAQDAPAVSPDRRLLVYDQYSDSPSRDLGLYVARSDGSHAHRILPPVAQIRYADPSFSPDGRWVAFARVRYQYGQSAIFVVRTSGSGLRRLTGYAKDFTLPRWSPNGTTIMFTDGESGGLSAFHGPLWSVSFAGGPPTAITHHVDTASWSCHGAWSPTGSQIVYRYYRPGWQHNQLRIVNANGTNDHLVWTSPVGWIVKSPDWTA